MANQYGPWATLIDVGGSPQLSAFWRRRLTMLVPTSQTSPVLSRRNLMGLTGLAVLAFTLPTFQQGGSPILAAEEAPAVATKPAQAAAIAEIEKRGGRVTLDENSPGRPVFSVDFHSLPITDADLKHVEGLTQLKYLNLSFTQVTDAGLERLQGLSQTRGAVVRRN